MAHLVTCLYCGKKVDRDKIPMIKVSARRYAHPECAEHKEEVQTQEQKDLEALEQYIMKLFDEPFVNARARKQINEYKEKYDYTYSGMLKTLIWWYEVKNNSIEKANGGIGIVPYIYEDANEYFKSIEKSSQKINPATFKMGSKIVDIDFSKEKKVETEDEKKQRIANIHGWDLSFSNPELYKDLE